ncbi:hypothetical protein PUN4_550177 [Paraburkholderia unamae]|nr:hypothetical protein PUN4_550177 [Paraburkholderia unamae]
MGDQIPVHPHHGITDMDRHARRRELHLLNRDDSGIGNGKSGNGNTRCRGRTPRSQG